MSPEFDHEPDPVWQNRNDENDPALLNTPLTRFELERALNALNAIIEARRQAQKAGIELRVRITGPSSNPPSAEQLN